MVLTSEEQSAVIFILLRWQDDKIHSQLKVQKTAEKSLSMRCVLPYHALRMLYSSEGGWTGAPSYRKGSVSRKSIHADGRKLADGLVL